MFYTAEVTFHILDKNKKNVIHLFFNFKVYLSKNKLIATNIVKMVIPPLKR